MGRLIDLSSSNGADHYDWGLGVVQALVGYGSQEQGCETASPSCSYHEHQGMVPGGDAGQDRAWVSVYYFAMSLYLRVHVPASVLTGIDRLAGVLRVHVKSIFQQGHDADH